MNKQVLINIGKQVALGALGSLLTALTSMLASNAIDVTVADAAVGAATPTLVSGVGQAIQKAAQWLA